MACTKGMLLVWLLLLPVLPCLLADDKIRYDGYQLWRIRWEDVEFSTQSLLEDFPVDIWNRSPMSADLLVSPEIQGKLRALLDLSNVTHTVVHPDVQLTIDEQMNSVQGSQETFPETLESFRLDKYHQFDTISKWMIRFARGNKNIVTLVNVGKSYHGRRMTALKIGAASRTAKEGVWIQAGVHAREWIAPASVLYMANKLVQDFGSDSLVTNLLVHFDWYVLPVLNPDGYVYSWKTDRLWRKTRSPIPDTVCIGVDGNRNYGFEWGGAGTSADPCDNEYVGPFPFSEPEIYSVANFLYRSSTKFRAFLDIHSYSQLWLFPWSYTLDPTPEADYIKQNSVAYLAVNTIKNVHGKDYTPGPYAATMYPSNGTAIDWAYGELGIMYSYTVELRDEGQYGFLLPEHEIRPTSRELYAAVKAVGRHLLKEKFAD
ncbi:carboxypeptidase B-like [Ptychodera flava]|uniref:carboxypeptidase B-like n=1 Tax=Ptychodera flava TaxID=63121 RepID=UPI00396A207A